MKKALIVLGGLVVLVVAGLLVVPMLIPVETYKTEILSQIEKATGRKAAIEGDFSIGLLPRAKFTAGKVSLANAPGGKAPQMVTLDRLDVRVAIFPLLSGTVVIDSFVLEKPVINLEVDRNGRPNWEFQTAAAKPAGPAEPSRPAPQGGDGGMALNDIRLGDVRLIDGNVSYFDARTNVTHTASDIDMTLSLPSLADPMKADGALVWNKEKIALALGIANPNAFMAGTATAVTASVTANPVKLTFKGEASGGKATKANGALDLDVPSVRRLAAWAGQPMTAPGDGFGPLKIAGNVAVDGQKYAFTQAKLSLDKMEASGDFRFDGSGRKPYVSAKLDAGTLDLNPYMPPEKPADPTAGQPKDRVPQPGDAAAQGWSEEPIDLTGLRAADADLALNLGGLIVRKIKVGKSQAKVGLKDGRLAAELTEMALYNGTGKARLTADGAGSVPAIAANLDLAGLQANPFLKDAAEFERLEGTANASMQITARGASQKAMVSALDGKGQVKFENGAIRGINIGAMIRNVGNAFLDPKAREQQKTDFAELSGTFAIKSGILRNDDLALLSPLLRVGGAGTVDLPQRTVNYRVEPKVAATAKGQGGPADAGGLMVPVVVSGPWHDLSYKPDLTGALGDAIKDPSKAVDQLKNLLPGSRDSGGGAGGSTGGGTPAPNPADALKKLFGR